MNGLEMLRDETAGNASSTEPPATLALALSPATQTASEARPSEGRRHNTRLVMAW